MPPLGAEFAGHDQKCTDATEPIQAVPVADAACNRWPAQFVDSWPEIKPYTRTV